MLSDCSKFLNRNVQTFGNVFHDTNGQNHGRKLNILWYFLNEICTVIHYLDCHGKGNWSKHYQNLDGKKYRIGNLFLFVENKGYFGHYMWMTSKWLERSRICLPCGRNRMKQSLNSFQRCLNHVFLLEHLKNYMGGENLTQRRSRGHMTWGGHGKKGAVKDVVSWQTKKDSNNTNSQLCLRLRWRP